MLEELRREVNWINGTVSSRSARSFLERLTASSAVVTGAVWILRTCLSYTRSRHAVERSSAFFTNVTGNAFLLTGLIKGNASATLRLITKRRGALLVMIAACTYFRNSYLTDLRNAATIERTTIIVALTSTTCISRVGTENRIWKLWADAIFKEREGW